MFYLKILTWECVNKVWIFYGLYHEQNKSKNKTHIKNHHTAMLSNSDLNTSFTYSSSFSSTDSVEEHSDEILLFCDGGLWKHCRQTGL